MEALIHALLLEDHQQPPRKRAKKVAPLTPPLQKKVVARLP